MLIVMAYVAAFCAYKRLAVAAYAVLCSMVSWFSWLLLPSLNRKCHSQLLVYLNTDLASHKMKLYSVSFQVNVCEKERDLSKSISHCLEQLHEDSLRDIVMCVKLFTIFMLFQVLNKYVKMEIGTMVDKLNLMLVRGIWILGIKNRPQDLET